jgi:hypothetical protein
LTIQGGFAIAAALAEFTGNASSDPAHLHDVQFAAARADALNLRFSQRANSGPFIELVVSVL